MLKTAFLLAMASAGRRSELKALVFDPQYIQFKPKGAGVTLYFTPEFMWKNQKPNLVNDLWYIPAFRLVNQSLVHRFAQLGCSSTITDI